MKRPTAVSLGTVSLGIVSLGTVSLGIVSLGLTLVAAPAWAAPALRQIAEISVDDGVIHEAFAFADGGARFGYVKTDTKGRTQLHVGAPGARPRSPTSPRSRAIRSGSCSSTGTGS